MTLASPPDDFPVSPRPGRRTLRVAERPLLAEVLHTLADVADQAGQPADVDVRSHNHTVSVRVDTPARLHQWAAVIRTAGPRHVRDDDLRQTIQAAVGELPGVRGWAVTVHLVTVEPVPALPVTNL